MGDQKEPESLESLDSENSEASEDERAAFEEVLEGLRASVSDVKILLPGLGANAAVVRDSPLEYDVQAMNQAVMWKIMMDKIDALTDRIAALEQKLGIIYAP